MSKIDLHGNTVHEAWKIFSDHVSDCYSNNIKSTTVITGDGKIAKEIIAWVHANQHCKTAKRGRNTGSFIVDIKTNKTTKIIKSATKSSTEVDLTPLLKKFNSY